MENKTLKIILIFAFIALVAGLGSLFVNLGSDWFNALTTPTQWIPNIVIPIVWTIIYLAFAVIFFFWVRAGGVPKEILFWGIVNGILNVLWCLVFFTLNQLFIGLLVIVLNLVAGWIFWDKIISQNKLYGRILTIYPIWLSIATCLNLALWILN